MGSNRSITDSRPSLTPVFLLRKIFKLKDGMVHNMSKPTNADFVFVEVTKTFMMTQAQARKLVRVARLVCSDREMISRDDDGSEIRTTGEHFLTDEGDHDFADAAGQLADPEGLLNVEMVVCSTRQLDDRRIQEISRFWPENWREETLGRLPDKGEEDSK